MRLLAWFCATLGSSRVRFADVFCASGYSNICLYRHLIFLQIIFVIRIHVLSGLRYVLTFHFRLRTICMFLPYHLYLDCFVTFYIFQILAKIVAKGLHCCVVGGKIYL